MSHPVPQQQSVADAARSDAASKPPVDRPLPEFLPHVPPPGPHSPIEREIERSERASAALAATRALARASFTDSQLAADDAAGEDDIDATGWIRTEYAALDHTVRVPLDEATPPAPRNLVGGSFNPGIASMHGRAFPGASPAHAAIKTRTGAHARFHHEARQTPRGEGGALAAVKTEHPGPAIYDKPAVVPMLAPAGAKAPTRVRARAPAPTGEPVRFLLAAGLGAVVVLIGGGVAWKAGWLSHDSATNASLITPQVAAQAEAARVLSAPAAEIAITPAAGAAPQRSNEEVDAALAAAARAAAVPVASVHAAGPARVARPVAPLAAVPAPVPAVPSTTAPHVPAKGKESVADAIAHAQARADSFLATAPAAPAVKPER